jgi:hypothetical protein
MPALPAATNCLRVRFAGTNQTTLWNNILYMQYTGVAPQVADLAGIAASMATAWTTNIAPLCATGVALNQISLTDLTNASAASADETVTGAGTRTGVAPTTATACVVSWSVNLRYRGGHPRTYFPAGVDSDIVSGHLWGPTFVTAMLTGARSFRTAMNAVTYGSSTMHMILLSYYANKILRPTPLPVTINDAKVHGRVDTQRKRLGSETT